MKNNRNEIINENPAVMELADDKLDPVTGGGNIPDLGTLNVGDKIPGLGTLGIGDKIPGIQSPGRSVSATEKKQDTRLLEKENALNQAIK